MPGRVRCWQFDGVKSNRVEELKEGTEVAGGAGWVEGGDGEVSEEEVGKLGGGDDERG